MRWEGAVMGNRNGQAVVLAYVTIAVLTILGGSLLNHALMVNQHSQTQQQQTDVFYLAEGGLEDAISKFSQGVANFQISINAPCYPDLNNDNVCGAAERLTTTFASGAIASSVIQEVSSVLPPPLVDPDGISVFVKPYHITTTVTHPANNTVTLTLHQVFTRRVIFTFQHAVFYDGDLEWLPGANMTLTGRVHSNSNIYLATESGHILTVDSEYLHAVGNLYHVRKDTTTTPTGTVQIKKAGSSPVTYPVFDPLNNESADSKSPTWGTDSQTTWNGTVKTAANGVTKRAVPVVGSIQAGGFYDSNANLKVTNCVITENGVQLFEGTQIPVGTCTSTTSFYNNREGKFVKMSNIDMTKLAGGTFSGKTYANHLPSNGLLYATRTDASATQEPGVRLLNGSTINRTEGLTVVSDGPVYLQGDFNTVSKKPTAVIGDSVNLLSNSWNDTNSTTNNVNSGTPRTASNTTFNTAFIAGVDTTVSGAYNGGLENYARLHERWSGKTLSITGSFVSLWNGQIATGPWKYGQLSSNSQYTAPTRNWNYDTSFSSGTNLPPFTPRTVEIVKGAWWKQ